MKSRLEISVGHFSASVTCRCPFPALRNHSINFCILPGYEAEGRVFKAGNGHRQVTSGYRYKVLYVNCVEEHKK